VAWTADQLWNNSALMALNAEMGLTMDQLVKLASALSKPAKLEPLTDERIMQFMAPWHIEDDAADRADIIKCVRAMLTHPSAGAGVPQEVAMPSENALLSCMQIPVDPEGHCPLTGDERSLYMATNVVYACAAAWGIRLKGEQQGYDSHQRYHDDNHG
jgi:hypothetical protein